MSERVKSNTRASVLRVDEARVHEAQGGDLQAQGGDLMVMPMETATRWSASERRSERWSDET